MKIIISFLLVLSCYTLKAQISAVQIKSDLAGKEWKIVKYESFSNEKQTEPEQLNDKIILNKDMTFLIVENGKEYMGNWTIQPEAYILCKSQTTEWSKTYKVISIAEKTAAIEHKDSDLTRTLYRLELK